MVYRQTYSYFKTKKYNGRDSMFENGVAQELELRKKAGDIKDYREQVTISLDVNGYHIANYKIDFVIQHNDGTTEYLEAKGFATDVWKLKWKLFEACYSDKPGVILTVEYQGKSWKPQRRRSK